MDSDTGQVSAFLNKLWSIIEDPELDDIICWDDSGHSFHILDGGRLAREVLPIFFKHGNLASFIRQLNMYGFRKQLTAQHGSLGSVVHGEDLEFAHPNFIRGHYDLLSHIQRKQSVAPSRVLGGSSVVTPPVIGIGQLLGPEPGILPLPAPEGATRGVSTARNVNSPAAPLVCMNVNDLRRLLSEVSSIRQKQNTTNVRFESLKRQNELLWQQLQTLREKHEKQQRLVVHMLNFLMAMMSGHGGFSSDMEPNLQITFQPSAAPTSTSPTATSVGGASVPTTANPLIEEAGSADAPTTPTVASSAAAATCSSGVGSSSTRQIYSFPSELLELVADLQEPEFRPDQSRIKIDDVTDEFLSENPDFTALVADGSHHSLADYAESLTPTLELMSALAVEQQDMRKTPLSPRTSLSLQPGSAFSTLSSLDLHEPLDLKPGIPLSSQLFLKGAAVSGVSPFELVASPEIAQPPPQQLTYLPSTTPTLRSVQVASVSVSTTPTRVVPAAAAATTTAAAATAPAKQLRAAAAGGVAPYTVIQPRAATAAAAAAGPTVVTRGVKRVLPFSEASLSATAPAAAASPVVLETASPVSNKSRQIIVPARLLPTQNNRSTASPVIVTIPSRLPQPPPQQQQQQPLEFDSTSSVVAFPATVVAPVVPRSMTAVPTIVVRPSAAQLKPTSFVAKAQPFVPSGYTNWPAPAEQSSNVAGLESSGVGLPEQQTLFVPVLPEQLDPLQTAATVSPPFDQLDTSATVPNLGLMAAAAPTAKLDDSYSNTLGNILFVPKIGSLDKGSGSSRRTDMEKSVDEMQSELDKLLASTNFLDLGIDLNDPSFLNELKNIPTDDLLPFDPLAQSGDLSLPFSVLPGTNPVVTSTSATAGGVLDTPQVVLADKLSPPFAFQSNLKPDDSKRLKTSI